MVEKALFDLGNVLLKFNFSKAHDVWIANGASADALESDAMTAIKISYECGGLSDDAFYDAAVRISGYAGDRDTFVRAWQDIFEVNTPMTTILEGLRSNGIPCYLLSNSNGWHVEHIQDSYEVLHHFDDLIFSHDAGLMKPDPAIFELAIESFGLDPVKTVYIDDLPANIAAGAAKGFQCILYDFQKHEEAVALLESLQLPL